MLSGGDFYGSCSWLGHDGHYCSGSGDIAHVFVIIGISGIRAQWLHLWLPLAAMTADYDRRDVSERRKK